MVEKQVGELQERTYRCKRCHQVVKRTLDQMEGNSITQGKLPAYLVCGKCLSEKPSVVSRMWATDLDHIPYRKRGPKFYDNKGIEKVFKKPSFERVSEISFAGCKRFLVRCLVHGPITERELALIAKKEVEKIIATEKVNAIAVGFWRTRSEAMRKQAVAMIEWAPGGVWADADKVPAGKYGSHLYHVKVNGYEK